MVYRLPIYEQVYVASRYNTVSGEQVGVKEASINKVQAGMGWFMTKNILVKGEYVKQEYSTGFAENYILHGAHFNGVVVEGVISF